VFKLLTSVQDVPSNCSVLAVTGAVAPPKPNAAVCIPAPPNLDLAVFKSLTSVQEVPLYFSVLPVIGGVPPKAKAAV